MKVILLLFCCAGSGGPPPRLGLLLDEGIKVGRTPHTRSLLFGNLPKKDMGSAFSGPAFPSPEPRALCLGAIPNTNRSPPPKGSHRGRLGKLGNKGVCRFLRILTTPANMAWPFPRVVCPSPKAWAHDCVEGLIVSIDLFYYFISFFFFISEPLPYQ